MRWGKKKDKRSSHESRKVVLHTLTRHWLDEGHTEFEYHDDVSEMLFWDLPKGAKPRTGTKNDYVLVDMDPILPPYSQEITCDKAGRPNPHNWFDAKGYYVYAIDNRIKEAEQAATSTMKPMRDIPWTKVITVVACAVVVALVVWRFVS